MRRSKKPRQALKATADAEAGKYVVYVHGICRHDAGYSAPWFAAMKPYVPDLPEENRRVVLWSDIVHPEALPTLKRAKVVHDLTLRLMHPEAAKAKATGVSVEIMDVLADRAQRQHLEANVRTLTVDGGAGPAALATLPGVAPQAMFGIPGLECVEDFSEYLLDRDIRDKVIGRFHQVVRPLVQQGARMEIISHSWGTVVAYEGLRLLDGEAGGSGTVHTFFTVGSALSIPPVKRRLIDEAIDGAKPGLVQTWVNLNARFDIVGGPLQGVPFAVDQDYLGLAPVGCSSIIPNPACAHSSYFEVQNVAVNRDIFGRYIEA